MPVPSALWSPQARMTTAPERQIVITEGDGAYVTTSTGQRLFDGTAGLWFANIGHGRADMARVAAEQIQRLETHHVFGRFRNDRALELAETLAGLSPLGEAKVILNSGGSDAIDVACKLARRFWVLRGRPQKRTILSREHAYHGLHAYGTSIAGLDFNREGYGTESLVPETARVDTHTLAGLEAAIHRIGPGQIAAYIAEPVMGTGGVIPPRDEYFAGVRRLCDAHDILFIADEVITGFGRTGEMFATSRFGLRPDLLTFAKGVTSGYAPLGGVLVGPRVWAPFFTGGSDAPIFRHGVTYSGHATAAALALHNLDILAAEGLIARAAHLEGVLSELLADLAMHELVEDVRVSGFLGGVQLNTAVDADALADALIEHCFITRALRGNTLQISPPFIATEQELRDLIAAIRGALDNVEA